MASLSSGLEIGRELYRGELPLASLFGVIGQAGTTGTLRAGNAGTDVRQADFNSSLLEPKGNRTDFPGVIKAQQPEIVHRECVHPGELRHPILGHDRPQPQNSRKNQKIRCVTI